MSLMDYIKGIFIGVWSLITGLAVTVKYLFKHAVTMQYPEERWKMPERFRGKVILIKEKCIACTLCAKACPVACLEVVPAVDEANKRLKTPAKFIYSMETCMFCGLCVEPCPTQAILMDQSYELSVYDRKTLVQDLIRESEERNMV